MPGLSTTPLHPPQCCESSGSSPQLPLFSTRLCSCPRFPTNTPSQLSALGSQGGVGTPFQPRSTSKKALGCHSELMTTAPALPRTICLSRSHWFPDYSRSKGRKPNNPGSFPCSGCPDKLLLGPEQKESPGYRLESRASVSLEWTGLTCRSCWSQRPELSADRAQ